MILRYRVAFAICGYRVYIARWYVCPLRCTRLRLRYPTFDGYPVTLLRLLLVTTLVTRFRIWLISRLHVLPYTPATLPVAPRWLVMHTHPTVGWLHLRLRYYVCGWIAVGRLPRYGYVYTPRTHYTFARFVAPHCVATLPFISQLCVARLRLVATIRLRLVAR